MSMTSSLYRPEIVLELSKKNADSVQFFTACPHTPSLKLGVITVNGNGFSNEKDLIWTAKKKATALGADFILTENAGIDKSLVYLPGSSSYKASASWGNSYGNYNATGYSIGPSITTISRPWAVFSVWAYAPSQLGVKFNGMKITGFVLNSPAETSGLKIGDQLIGIDGFDTQDLKLAKHLMGIKPGSSVVVSVQRDTLFEKAKRYDYNVKMISNL